MTLALTRTFTRVAADVSRRHNGCGQNAPTDVGGYAFSVNPAECGISEPDLITNNGAKLRIVTSRAEQSGD